MNPQLFMLLLLLTVPPVFAEAAEGISQIEQKTGDGHEKKYLLRYHFEKGETLRWNVLQTIRATTAMRGVEETLETSSRSVKIWTVRETTAQGTATFEYRIERLEMSEKQTDRKPIRYDSGCDKTVPPKFRLVAGSVGKPLAHITINGFGETIKKIPLAEYAAEAQENKIAVPLPQEPVAVGESWVFPFTIDASLPGGGVKKLNARQRFKLESVRTGIATISFETQILTPINDPKIELQVINTWGVGTLELDIEKGKTVSQRTTVDRTVIGFQNATSHMHHQTRLIECCCGFSSCDICNPAP